MAHDRVLLAIGPEDRDSLNTLVDAAIDLAEPAGATVYLLYVFPRDDYETVMEQMDIDTTTSGLTPDEVAQRHESVREPAERLESLGIDYEIRGVSGGNASDQIVRKIEQVEADVAVVGGTKRSPAGKAMFGDHAQQVLLNAPVPVLYVKRE
ncbi:universal stress protein [Haloarcula litorea]|uniref:universal stress protein n=1 Tax=Haloarcula litorea TaxID=3032579 RepID=UPI0023E8B009|nr:universal stress protein [Halomicroarcula sp. GDY20]